MATTPLFVADIDVLKSKLRLSGVASTSDAEDIIDEAVLTVRSNFHRELGAARIAEVQAISFVEDPSSDDEILRAVANVTEVKWVRSELLRVLPTLFQDGAANQTQIYHDEAVFRETTSHQLDQERIRLESEIEINLDLLRGSQSITSETSIRIDGTVDTQPVVDPAYPRPRPGDTAVPNYLLARRWRGHWGI